jgi:hypothetical protein
MGGCTSGFTHALGQRIAQRRILAHHPFSGILEGNCSARGRVEWAAGNERLKRIEEGDALLAYGRQQAPQASERIYALSERMRPDSLN